jgi:hypothetical protein
MLRTPEERHRTAGTLFPVSPSGKVWITASYYTLRKAKSKTVTAAKKISSIRVSCSFERTIPILSHGSLPAEWRGKQLCGGKAQ